MQVLNKIIFFFTIASVLPFTAFSAEKSPVKLRSYADFNKKTALKNSEAYPLNNCDSPNQPAYSAGQNTNNLPPAAPPASLNLAPRSYYGVSPSAPPASTPTTPSATTTPPNTDSNTPPGDSGILLSAPKNSNSPTWMP